MSSEEVILVTFFYRLYASIILAIISAKSAKRLSLQPHHVINNVYTTNYRIDMQHHDSLNAYISQSVRENWEQLALTDFNGVSYQYKDVARKIAKLHLLFEQAGVNPGDRIALCGRNSSQWAVAFLSVITYGAVVVPILNEIGRAHV